MGHAIDRLTFAMDRLHEAEEEALATPLGAVNAHAAWSSLRVAPPDRDAMAQGLLFPQGGPSAQNFDLLRTRLVQMARQKGWKRVAVTSPGAGSGKSTLVANLALSMSRLAEQSIVLWDCDLRRPRQSQLFGVTPRHSVGEVLRKEVSFADQGLRLRANLALAANPAAEDHAAETLLAGKAGAVLRAVETAFAPSMMLFDLPPFGVADDAAALLPEMDGAIIVALADVTTLPEVDRCEREVAGLTDVMGIVLNQARMEGRRGGYGGTSY